MLVFASRYCQNKLRMHFSMELKAVRQQLNTCMQRVIGISCLPNRMIQSKAILHNKITIFKFLTQINHCKCVGEGESQDGRQEGRQNF